MDFADCSTLNRKEPAGNYPAMNRVALAPDWDAASDAESVVPAVVEMYTNYGCNCVPVIADLGQRMEFPVDLLACRDIELDEKDYLEPEQPDVAECLDSVKSHCFA